jgi:hypothetical protein
LFFLLAAAISLIKSGAWQRWLQKPHGGAPP